MTRTVRAAMLGAAGAAMVAGVWGGLVRAGAMLPSAGPAGPGAHGLMLVVGFFGTLISLERAVALDRWWAYLAPPLAVFGAVGLAAGIPGAGWPALAAGLVLAAGTALLWRGHPSLFLAVMTAGAAAWVVAMVLQLAGAPADRQAPWLAGFLVLVVVGERLELSRLAPPSRWKTPAFGLATGAYAAGLTATLVALDTGSRLMGGGLILLAGWLAVFDVARRTVRMGGVTRFISVCLLSGYGWLAVGGLGWLAWGGLAAGFGYDLVLHAVLVGFVFSMVFGHVHLVAPAVIGVQVPFRRRFFGHLILLHAGLLLRVWGDLVESATLRRWGAWANAAAILVFAVSTVAAVVAGRREEARSAVPDEPATLSWR
jgi:hypothetical protein